MAHPDPARAGATSWADPAWAVPAYLVVVVAKVASTGWAATRLPDRVASHFGAGGQADDWSSRTSFLVTDAAISAAMIVGLPLLGVLLGRGSGAGLNLPDKEWWLQEENRPLLRRKLLGDLLVMATAVGALLVWLDLAVVRANRSAEPELGASSLVVVGVFVAATLWWALVVMRRRYTVPRSGI